MSASPRRRGSGKFVMLWVSATAFILIGAGANSEDRIQVLPRLQHGDTLRYESHARINRYVRTKSSVVTMYEPTPLQADFSTNLQLTVHDFHEMDHRPMMAADTKLPPSDTNGSGSTASPPVKVDFTINGNGDVTRADGLDDLDPLQRLAWRFWVSQFAFGWTLPPSGVKPGEKWRSVEEEKTPTPIANLVWERETTYVQDDKCPIVPMEQCAVFLINATLRQKSKPENTTPEDYQLHQLKTAGTAKGTNEAVIYISRKTGLLMRASEDIQQTLDVTIAKADGSNQVQYLVDVKSHFETLFMPAAGAGP